MASEKFTGMDIVQDIERQILHKKLVRGVRLNTSRELAARYDVSQKTVERAMAQLSDMGLITRTRGKGTFVLSSVPLRHKLRVCFLTFRQLTFLEDSAGATYAAYGYSEQKIQHLLMEDGYNVEHIVETSERAEDRDALLKIKLESYDIVIVPAGAQDYADYVLRSANCQKILINDDQVRPGPWHQIVYDYRPGMDKALQYFRQKRVDKIISVGFMDDDIARHRVETFSQEAQKYGYLPNDLKAQYVKENQVSRFFAGQNFAEFYIDRNLYDHAIFSASDFLMIGMMMTFKRAGKVPGRDFQIVSYDNFQDRIGHPDFQFNISSITHPQDAQNKALLSMLDSLENKKPETDFYQTYFVPAKDFVIRRYS